MTDAPPPAPDLTPTDRKLLKALQKGGNLVTLIENFTAVTGGFGILGQFDNQNVKRLQELGFIKNGRLSKTGSRVAQTIS